MERQDKDARETTDEDEEASQRPSLSDFLSLGLRESQRPAPVVRDSQRPAPAATELETTTQLPDEPQPLESPAETPESPAETAVPTVAEDPDALFADRPSVRPQTVSVADHEMESETEYVVPVARPRRQRIVAGAAAASALIVLMAWWLSRERKPPPHPEQPREVSTQVAHEPLLPAPPPIAEEVEPVEPDPVDSVSQSPKAGGGPAGPESASSAAPPFGPNVARYPDLPTPVLIQLEKDQQESKKPK